VQSVAQGPPFNGASDVQLGTALLAIFLLFNNLTFWALGGSKLISLDYSRPAAAPFAEVVRDRLHSLRHHGRPPSRPPSPPPTEYTPRASDGLPGGPSVPMKAMPSEPESVHHAPPETPGLTLSPISSRPPSHREPPTTQPRRTRRQLAEWILRLVIRSLLYPPSALDVCSFASL
jgi:hypothetical protein